MIALPTKGGFILRRFTMLYGVGLAASTNNCQLNVLRIDRPRCQLRESSEYPSIKRLVDFSPFLSVSVAEYFLRNANAKHDCPERIFSIICICILTHYNLLYNLSKKLF